MSVEETLPIRCNGIEPLTTTVEGFEDCFTICDILEAVCKKYRDNNLYRFRNVVKQHIEWTLENNKKFITYEYGEGKELTYGQFFDMVKATSRGLTRYCPDLKPKSRIGIYLDTCLEWSLAFQSILRASHTVVTVYATLGWENLVASLNESEIDTIVCAADNVQNMDLYLGGKCPKLQRLICVGNIHYKSKHFKMVNLYTLMEDGFAHPSPVPIEMPKRDDLALIMYTSGTTGDPKGVMIQHQNVIATCSGFTRRLKFCTTDTHMSYLPFAHIFEMTIHMSIICSGGQIAFASPRTLFAKPGGAKKVGGIAFAKPTVFCGVPKVWETLRKGVGALVRTQGSMEQFMFNMVLGEKMKLLTKGINKKIKFEAAGGLYLEDTVFAKVRGMMGGNLRVVISGGAPLNPGTQYFLQACLGPEVSVVQGYGLTETVAASTIQLLNEESDKYRVSSVGIPPSCVELKVVSVPEMGYSAKSKPPKGELCVRGPNMSVGYYKKERITKMAYDEDGWFHTGDIVQVNEDNNSVSVIDRKKNLVKLNHGEYVAVEALEVAYGLSNFVSPNGIFVHVDPMKDFCVAIIVPDGTFMKQFAAKMNLDFGTLISNPVFKKAMEDDFLEIAKKEQMKKWEIMTTDRFVLKNDMWLPQNGMLTAASKLKRRALRKKYEVDLVDLYRVDKKEKVECKRKRSSSETDRRTQLPEFFKLMKPGFV